MKDFLNKILVQWWSKHSRATMDEFFCVWSCSIKKIYKHHWINSNTCIIDNFDCILFNCVLNFQIVQMKNWKGQSKIDFFVRRQNCKLYSLIVLVRGRIVFEHVDKHFRPKGLPFDQHSAIHDTSVFWLKLIVWQPIFCVGEWSWLFFTVFFPECD